MTTSVSVCLNTYMRPEVTDCLRSIHRQICDVALSIVVSDNDASASGRGFVEQFTQETGRTVSYEVVPEKNIAIARNSAVARAVGDWILFIDDDEVAPDNWVAAMLFCAELSGADVVLGTVNASYAEGAPAWLVSQDPMSKKWGATGKLMNMASTCNTLVRATWLKERGFSFDPAYGRAGCDDAELFHRMYRAGAKIVVCADAPLSEVAPLDRANVDYLRKRFLRLGQSYAVITNRYRTFSSRFVFLGDAILRASVFGGLAPIFYFIDRSRWLGFKLIYWRNVGKIQQTVTGELTEMY